MRTTVYSSVTESELDAWRAWPIDWSAVWVGALAALAAAVVFGLAGTVIGAVSLRLFTSWHSIGILDVVVAVCAAFFAFVIGGWVAGRISGFRHAEPAMLHAVIAWLVALPLLLVLSAIGAGNAFNAWYGGAVTVVGTPYVASPSLEIVRITSLAALTSILIGLIGAALGGWMASGEPMNFSHHRTRTPRMFMSNRRDVP